MFEVNNLYELSSRVSTQQQINLELLSDGMCIKKQIGINPNKENTHGYINNSETKRRDPFCLIFMLKSL